MPLQLNCNVAFNHLLSIEEHNRERRTVFLQSAQTMCGQPLGLVKIALQCGQRPVLWPFIHLFDSRQLREYSTSSSKSFTCQTRLLRSRSPSSISAISRQSDAIGVCSQRTWYASHVTPLCHSCDAKRVSAKHELSQVHIGAAVEAEFEATLRADHLHTQPNTTT